MTERTSRRAGAAIWLVCLLAASAPAVAEDQPAMLPDAGPAGTVMLGARVVGDNQRVRFVADLSRKLDAAAFTLADPYRIVVDLPEMRFELPELAGATGRGLVSAFRYGLISRGKSRIVIDLTVPAVIERTFVTDAGDGQPARLVIDILPTTRAKFMEATRAYRETQTVAAAQKADRLFATPGGRSDKLTVVVDPGHGGIDDGAHGTSGTVEKNVTLAFAKVLGDRLGATGRYRVIYTREDDTFVALGERVAIARQHSADLFVSIHANSFPGGSVRGAIVYTIAEGASDTDKEAEAVAATENQSDALAGIDIGAGESSEVKDILLDLTRRETRNFGLVFADNLVKELKKLGKNSTSKIPLQKARFKVLEAPDVPSALFELGYLTNAADEKLLISPEWQNQMAITVSAAIDAYFLRRVAAKGGQ